MDTQVWTDVDLAARAAPVPARRTPEPYPMLLARLSHQSVVKHFDAYADIDWDSATFRIDPDDPLWELGPDDPLGGTAWYRTRPPGLRARIGLHTIATLMKIGLQFENVLKRGLLEFTFRLPNGAPEFRYAYHEVIEEAQHGLMFAEFVRRSGLEVPGLGRWERLLSGRVVTHARRFPALFFIFVLGGEEPIDHVQRTALRSDRPIHPLLRRIMQIHVTEEARHLCFARHYLRAHVPRLAPWSRAVLALGAPLVLAQMARLMMRPAPHIVRTYDIPRTVIAAAYDHDPVHRGRTIAALATVRALCEELGLLTPWSAPLWRRLGLLAPRSAAA